MIDNYAISQNIQIANASEVGLLNVFPRVGLKEVIDT